MQEKNVAFDKIFVSEMSSRPILAHKVISTTRENRRKPCWVCKKTKGNHLLTSLSCKASRMIPCSVVTFLLDGKKYFDAQFYEKYFPNLGRA